MLFNVKVAEFNFSCTFNYSKIVNENDNALCSTKPVKY